VISVFHDLNLAAAYCKKLLLLKEGRVIAYGNGSDVLKSEIIRDAYGVDVEIRNHPLTGSPYVVPLSRAFHKGSKKNLKVHVICGGGTGSALFRLLSKEGYDVSAGVLSWPDFDYEYASALGIDIVGEAPFCPVGEQSHKENLARIRDADAVILTDMPVSTGNIKNLEAFKVAVSEGKFAISVSETSPEKRDFAGGRAVQLLNEIYSTNVILVPDVRSTIKALLNK